MDSMVVVRLKMSISVSRFSARFRMTEWKPDSQGAQTRKIKSKRRVTMNFDTERTSTNAGASRRVSPRCRKTAASIVGLLSFIALTGMTAQRALGQQPSSGPCTLATVQGSYGLVGSGTYFGEPATVTGVFTTNGTGNFTYEATQNINGTVNSFSITGTYTVNANCSATVTFINGETFSAVVVSGGSEIDFQSTTPDLIQTVVAKKVS
jgi:hypothetical protein